MKNILNFILISTLLFSCVNTDTESSSTEKADILSLTQIAENLDGFWISDSYLKDIETKKSIFESRMYTTEILGFYLDKEKLLSEEAMLEGFTEHEGGFSSPLIYDEDKHKFINNMTDLSEYPSFSKPFELNFIDKNLLEMHFTKSKKKDVYRKINTDLETTLRETLIAGSYKPEGLNQTIQLNADGSVQNFIDFQFYELVYDFVEGIEYDTLLFYSTEDGGSWDDATVYKFEWDGNQLKLQEVKLNWDTMEHEISDNVLVLEKE